MGLALVAMCAPPLFFTVRGCGERTKKRGKEWSLQVGSKGDQRGKLELPAEGEREARMGCGLLLVGRG